MPEAQPQKAHKRAPEPLLPSVAAAVDPAPQRFGHADVLAAIAAEEPTLSPESVRLLAAELLAEHGGLPEALELVGPWAVAFKAQCPICWPAVMAADPGRFASLCEFSLRPGRTTADTLRTLMGNLAELSTL
jgi:hypothetical protein